MRHHCLRSILMINLTLKREPLSLVNNSRLNLKKYYSFFSASCALSFIKALCISMYGTFSASCSIWFINIPISFSTFFKCFRVFWAFNCSQTASSYKFESSSLSRNLSRGLILSHSILYKSPFGNKSSVLNKTFHHLYVLSSSRYCLNGESRFYCWKKTRFLL